MDPTLDGQFVFGTACHVVHVPNPSAVQKDEYFGINGRTSLFGGQRGRRFHVTGVLIATDLPSVGAAAALLLSFNDGIERVFTDSFGNAWPNVTFEGAYQPSPDGPVWSSEGWCLPYTCTLESQT